MQNKYELPKAHTKRNRISCIDIRNNDNKFNYNITIMNSFKGYMNGPRWAHLKKALYELAMRTDCELNILDHDKGLLGETIYFEVTGEDESIDEFESIFNSAGGTK